MISEKRLAANRANGALSRGPKTNTGKARSSQNALRHGLLAKAVLLRNENAEAFQALLDAYIDRFSPADEVELGLVEEMVASYWRTRRAFSIEMNMLDKDMNSRAGATELDRMTDSFSDLATSPKLHVLHRYQTRLHLIHSRCIRDLAILRMHLSANASEPDIPEADVIDLPVSNAETQDK
jgi:hypothetical protein